MQGFESGALVPTQTQGEVVTLITSVGAALKCFLANTAQKEVTLRGRIAMADGSVRVSVTLPVPNLPEHISDDSIEDGALEKAREGSMGFRLGKTWRANEKASPAVIAKTVQQIRGKIPTGAKQVEAEVS